MAISEGSTLCAPCPEHESVSYFAGKKVLVAGGAGFIGSYLVEYLVADGASVTVADNLSRGRVENLHHVRDDIRFQRVDLRESDATRSVCRGKDVVMNLAAPIAGVEYSRTHHAEMLTETLLLSANTLEAARRADVPRYLYCSSSCVYPDDAIIPTPESEVERNEPESQNQGYGWGKRMGERQAQYYARDYGMQIAIGRPFNAYGAREYPEEIEKAHVIPAILSRILNREEPLVIWGSGNQTRSFVHARDFALGLKLLTEHYAEADPVNVGHDHETSIRDLVGLLLEITGRRPRVVFDTTRPEGAQRKSADVTKLMRATGFVPSTSLAEGLVEMVEFFHNQRSVAL
jgi:nucleoside-diphosphate-sugar epimerase